MVGQRIRWCALCVGLLWNSHFAQGVEPSEPLALKFSWTVDQELSFQVNQTTTVHEDSIDEQSKKPVKISTVTKMKSTKIWHVKAVNESGAATLEMRITAMSQEMTQTVGEKPAVVKVMDSANPEDAKAMTFLNKPVLTVQVSDRGEILDTESENPGSTDRLRVELPFRSTLPTAAMAVNSSWERNFDLKLPPPMGTGEKFEGNHKFTYKGMNAEFAVVGLSTTLKTTPKDLAIMPAVLPVLWEGDVFFNTKTGCYHGAKLKVKQEIPNFHGEDTKFVYESEYTEVPSK